MTPHFRLLLHGQDGSIPYLTPELMRLVFCPPNGVEDTTSTSEDNDDDDLQQSWKWHRDHLILGVAVKDTCVTAVYRDIKTSSSNSKKRKNEQQNGGSDLDRFAKKVKSDQSTNNDAPSSNTQKLDTTTSATKLTNSSKEGTNNNTSKNQQPLKSNDMNTKKPAGYTFLTPPQSAQICKEINSHINCKATTTNGSLSSTNYMQTYLRIPQYISTLIVPTFTLDSPNKSASDVNKSSAQDVNKNKHVPKQTSDHNQSKPKQQKKAKDVIPNSNKDSMPVDTPHGWQKIKPEQYVDAVTSLTTNSIPSSTDATASSDIETAKSLCEGAVGLFDHMNTSRDQANRMFAQFMKDKSSGSEKAVLTPQAHKSIEGMVVKGKWETMVQKLVQRTNDWSISIANYNSSPSSMPFWLPVHMAASHLPLKYMFSCPRSSPSREETQSVLNKLSEFSHVAITGWDSISYSREYRRQALRQLMITLQQTPTSITTPLRRMEYLILAVNDIQSILDAAREGVSIIGTDMVRLWSRDGMALCLDLSLDNEDRKNETDSSGMMDLSDEKYARDSSSLLPGCQCVTCRPRQINTRSNHLNTKCMDDQTKKSAPSFTRAYIHHLIKANEMLAETLLFVHNLHQMLLLFCQLSKAASLDDKESRDEKRNLEAFCQKIEEQL